MDASDARVRTLEMDVYELPLINGWRQVPSREQVAYATDLCNSELPFPERTINRFATMSRYEMSNLIRSLKIMRAARLKGQERNRRWRLVL